MNRATRVLLFAALGGVAVAVVEIGPGEMFDWLLGLLGSALAFFYNIIPSYGVAIILVTAMVRLVMLPLTIKQTRSMQAMQKLQPEIKKLQSKHKGDRQKLNEEMMGLYKEHQVNPLGGCLPLLLQLPIFIALYRVFIGCGKVIEGGCAPGYVGVQHLPAGSALATAIVAGRADFLGMDLGRTPTEAWRVGIVAVIPYAVLVLLMALTTWYQQKQISSAQTGPQMAQMQMMGRIMPVMLAFFSLNLPAGVSVYWVASNLWTIGQQYALIGRHAGRGSAVASGATEARGGNVPAKPRPAAAKPAPNPPTNPSGKPRQGGDGRRPGASGGRAGANSKPAAKPKGTGARKRRNRR